MAKLSDLKWWMRLFYTCEMNEYEIVHKYKLKFFTQKTGIALQIITIWIKKIISGQNKGIETMVATVFHMCNNGAGTALQNNKCIK